MLLAYLLLFLLSTSTCGATSRNHRIFLNPGSAGVGAPSPAIHDRRHIANAKDLFHDALYPYGMMGAPPPSSSLGVEAPQPPDEVTVSAATMEPSPSPSPSPSPQIDNNGGYYGEPRGGDVVGGGSSGEGGPPSSEPTTAAAEQVESSVGDDVSIDYAGPKTHPPSHN